jgi:hypothetical protein
MQPFGLSWSAFRFPLTHGLQCYSCLWIDILPHSFHPPPNLHRWNYPPSSRHVWDHSIRRTFSRPWKHMDRRCHFDPPASERNFMNGGWRHRSLACGLATRKKLFNVYSVNWQRGNRVLAADYFYCLTLCTYIGYGDIFDRPSIYRFCLNRSHRRILFLERIQ